MDKNKKKQLFLSTVAALFIAMGYLSFQKAESEKLLSQIDNNIVEPNIGDVQLVNSETLNVENEIVNEVVIDSNVENSLENNNVNNNDYFVKTRLERENMYSMMIESYEEIINNKELSSEQKSIAVQEISNINNLKNGIMISENLIKNKGFDDVVILVNNNSVSVVVKKNMLLDADIVKIQNIIETKMGFKLSNISITNIN